MDEQQGRKLMDRVRDRVRIKHYSRSTESIYCHWILQYILFLYREVLEVEPPQGINAMRAKRHLRIPVVLSVGEVQKVIAGMSDPFRLMAELPLVASFL